MDKDTLVINLFSGPGAGKSTMAAGVFHYLKMHGWDCELVTEYAKFVTWEKNWKALENQFYVTAKQLHREFVVLGQVDVLITDSPLLLGLMYYKTDNDKLRDAYEQMVVETFKQRNNYNVFIERKRSYNPNGRNQTLEESKQIDFNILTLLNKYGFTYDTVSGTKVGTDDVAKKIERELREKRNNS
jgi:hypothetical protein